MVSLHRLLVQYEQEQECTHNLDPIPLILKMHRTETNQTSHKLPKKPSNTQATYHKEEKNVESLPCTTISLPPHLSHRFCIICLACLSRSTMIYPPCQSIHTRVCPGWHNLVINSDS